MKLESPRNWTGDLASAHEAARAAAEPIFVPAPVYADDRGWSIMNQFQGVLGPQGQMNYSVVYPGVIKAWHRHALQTDFWMCVLNHVKVGVHRDDGRTWMAVIGERRAGILVIPPTLWHGMTPVGPDPAGLFYYVTHAYNLRNPDEERRAFDGVVGFPWEVQHR